MKNELDYQALHPRFRSLPRRRSYWQDFASCLREYPKAFMKGGNGTFLAANFGMTACAMLILGPAGLLAPVAFVGIAAASKNSSSSQEGVLRTCLKRQRRLIEMAERDIPRSFGALDPAYLPHRSLKTLMKLEALAEDIELSNRASVAMDCLRNALQFTANDLPECYANLSALGWQSIIEVETKAERARRETQIPLVTAFTDAAVPEMRKHLISGDCRLTNDKKERMRRYIANHHTATVG